MVWQKKTPNICLGSMICYLFYLSGAYSSVPCRYLVNYKYDYMNFIEKLPPNHITSKKKNQDWLDSKDVFLYYPILFTHCFFFFLIGNYGKGRNNYTYLACRAAVCGVAQSLTRLKRLSRDPISFWQMKDLVSVF